MGLRGPQTQESKNQTSQKIRALWKDPQYRMHMVEIHRGKKQTVETVSKRVAHYTGEKHWAWKGKKVPYRTLHQWVENHLGKPSICIACGIEGSGHSMHWANKSREYKRDLSDWIRLCASCHGAYDRNKLELPLAY